MSRATSLAARLSASQGTPASGERRRALGSRIGQEDGPPGRPQTVTNFGQKSRIFWSNLRPHSQSVAASGVEFELVYFRKNVRRPEGICARRVTRKNRKKKKCQKRDHEAEKEEEILAPKGAKNATKKGRHSALAQIAPARSPSHNSLPRATG